MARAVHNILVNRIHDRALRRHAARHLRGRLIDIGCGTKPYERMLAPYVDEHVGVDREDPFNPHARVDVIGVADDLPVKDFSFDSALGTATLEHLPEPEAALRETYRVLRPGGVAIYTVPLIWHIHAAPWDYYRYTRYGLQHLFEKTGFEVVEIEPLSGFWVTFGQLFSYYLQRFNHGPLRWLRIVAAASIAVQAIGYRLDQLDRAEDWTWMYLVVARKPATT